MIRVLEETQRILAYGGFGVLIGFIVGRRASDDHALKSSILKASGEPMSEPGLTLPKWARGTVYAACVILLMVALLGTGVSTIVNNRQDADQAASDEASRQRLCAAVSELTKTLNHRTQATREAARVNDDLWRGIRHIVIKFSDNPDNPLLPKINTYLEKRQQLIAEQKANPYNVVDLKDCDG